MNKIFNVYQNQATCRTELTILGIKFKFLNKNIKKHLIIYGKINNIFPCDVMAT